jgi:hypothetical protein
MRSKKWLIGLALLLVVAAASWYFASPAWTLRQMATAAEAGDAERLGAYVDFPAVRESTKSQLKAQLVGEMAGRNTQGFEALGAMIAMQMIDPMVDAIVTPEAMKTAFARRGKTDAAPGVPSGGAPSGASSAASGGRSPFSVPENAEIVREGLDRFTLRDKTRPDGGGLLFERRGLGWRLIRVEMPDLNQAK